MQQQKKKQAKTTIFYLQNVDWDDQSSIIIVPLRFFLLEFKFGFKLLSIPDTWTKFFTTAPGINFNEMRNKKKQQKNPYFDS